MSKRLVLLIAALAAVVVVVLGGATLAFGGGAGMIWDDGHYAKPGSLDDGKDLLPQTTITLVEANARAQRAAAGALGQVDLERRGDRILYAVDVGDQEVRVDAADGHVVSVTPRD